MKKSKLLIISNVIALIIFSACESKVTEKKAEGYKDSITTENKVTVQAELDRNVDQLQAYIDQLKKIITTAQSLIKEDSTPLSVFDIIATANLKIKNQTAQLKDQKLNLKGQFQIPTTLLTEDCQQFDYQITADSILPLKELNYAVKSCYTENTYLNVLKAKFIKQRVTLTFNNENLQLVLPPEVLKSQISECHFSNNASDVTLCKNIVFAQSSRLVWSADLVSQGATTLIVKGVSKKSGTTIYTGLFKFNSEGRLDGVPVLTGPSVVEE